MNRINKHLIAPAAMLLSGLLLLAAPAQAQFATGGSGAYRNNILWFDWGTNGANIPQAGTSVTNNVTIAGQTLAVTCQLTAIGGNQADPDLSIYRPGGYSHDGLDDLYNIGGTGAANTMDIGLKNRTSAAGIPAGVTANFTFACSAMLGSNNYPLSGLVFADAEATNGAEFIDTTPSAGTTLRVIERLRAPGCVAPYTVIRSGNNYRFTTNDIFGCDITTPPDAMGVYFLDGTASATINISSVSGFQAVALGVMLHVADYGDAPTTYGTASHLPQMTWSGGTVPDNATTDIFNMTLATLGQPNNALLGARVDVESQAWAGPTALLDDSNGTPDDEDGVNTATLAVLHRGLAGATYTVPVTCVGTAPVAGWIDFNLNGTFQADERSATTTCSGGNATLSWAAVNADIAAGQSYLRVRTALAATDIANPTGLAASGETEDYAITIADPRIRVAKVTVGGIGGPFAFTTTNTGAQPSALTTAAAGTAVVGAPVSIRSLGTAVVVTEPTLPAGWALAALTCSNTGGAALVATYDLPKRTATIPSASLSTTSDITCTFENKLAPPPPFASCPVDAFVTSGSNLYSMSLLTGAMTNLGSSGPLAGDSVNGIGFRQADGYIWGYYNTGAEVRLVRIGQNGQADLPYATRPTGMVSGGIYTADIQPSTGYYVAATTSRLYFIDVTTNAVVSQVASTAFDNSSDMAFHPTDGNIYGVRNGSGQVFRVNPATGASTNLSVSLPMTPGSGGWGGIFFDASGTMYAYRSGSSGTPGIIHRIFNVDGTGSMNYDVLAPNADRSTNLDGARCPAAPATVPPALLLRKTTVGAVGGAFGFSLNTTSVKNASVTTTTAGVPVQVDGDSGVAGDQLFTVEAASIGAALTIAESSLPAGWKLKTAECKNRAGAPVGTLAGDVYTIPGSAVVAGELFQCDVTNERNIAALSITKTNNTASVVAGSTTTYIVTVTNTGIAGVNNATIRDNWTTLPGLDCSAGPASCAASGTAGTQCPAPGAVTPAALQAGLLIPVLPPGGVATFALACVVTASGL